MSPALGFLQCPNDYRDHRETAFEAICYAEYTPFQKIELPVRGEWCSGFTVGTLSLIRRHALERAGMWAPWCLTDDPELAIRIHALGYRAYNLQCTLGRDLIPGGFRALSAPAVSLEHGTRAAVAAPLALLAPLSVFSWGWIAPPGPEAERIGAIPAPPALSAPRSARKMDGP